MWNPFQNKMRRVAVALVTMVAGAGMALAFVAPAQAAATEHMVVMAASVPAVVAVPAVIEPGCASAELCLWVNSGFRDGPGVFRGSNADLRADAHSTCQTGNWSDCASSVDNATSTGETLFKNINGGGDSRCVPTGMTISNLATAKYTTGAKSIMNDSISSNLLGPC
jgi:hypothetical protein